MTKKNKLQTTIEELLSEELPLPVKDWLQKFVDGKPTPYADRIDEDSYYFELEMMVAVLADDNRTAGSDLELPEAAKDFVQEYLYRLEASSEVHIWNSPEVLRAAWPLMMTGFYDAGTWLAGDVPGQIVVKTALRRLCTRAELMEFYERHGFEDNYKGRDELPGSVSVETYSDKMRLTKAARILADPRTDEDVSQRLREEINELANSTQVGVAHPALVERALTLMFEARRKGYAKEIKRNRAALLKLLDELPEPGDAAPRLRVGLARAGTCAPTDSLAG
jgi:hypothetical protein